MTLTLQELVARVERLEQTEARVRELEARVKVLEHENYLLRVENAALKQQLAQRDEKIARLEAEIKDLRFKLRQNSQNSSKPPSSDPPWQTPSSPDKPAASTRRKPGGQKGHKGEYRELLPSEEVTRFHDYPAPETCRSCGHDLKGVGAQEPLRVQVTELPAVTAEVHEHRAEVVCCPGCGTKNRGEMPASVYRPFGPRLTAAVALLSGVFRLSKRNVERMLSEMWQVKLSLGAVSNTEAVIGDALAEPYQEALQYGNQSPVPTRRVGKSVSRRAGFGSYRPSWSAFL